MELKELVINKGIIGVIGTYKSTLQKEGLVKDLDIKNISQALKMVGLNETFISKNIEELSLNELWKIELASKLHKDIIIIGALSDVLNYKDIEYIKKLLIKLANDYNKKIIVIDNSLEVFFNLVKEIVVVKDHEVIYKTNDYFHKKLYEYVKIPKIVEFINYANKDKKRINKTIEIYELIKDIYRSVS